MPTIKKRINFSESEEGIEVIQILQEMTADTAFHTQASYNANETLYPDHLMPFVDKHLQYLRTHPDISPQDYIANLRLMTRIR